jgi:hypothetical protein
LRNRGKGVGYCQATNQARLLSSKMNVPPIETSCIHRYTIHIATIASAICFCGAQSHTARSVEGQAIQSPELPQMLADKKAIVARPLEIDNTTALHLLDDLRSSRPVFRRRKDDPLSADHLPLQTSPSRSHQFLLHDIAGRPKIAFAI